MRGDVGASVGASLGKALCGRAIRLHEGVAFDVGHSLREAATGADDVQGAVENVAGILLLVQVVDPEGLPLALIRPPSTHLVSHDVDVHAGMRTEIDDVAVRDGVVRDGAEDSALDLQPLPFSSVVPLRLHAGAVDVDVVPEEVLEVHGVARPDRPRVVPLEDKLLQGPVGSPARTDGVVIDIQARACVRLQVHPVTRTERCAGRPNEEHRDDEKPSAREGPHASHSAEALVI
mmetsp:Transcript_143595/g.459324  ORF Transcript_143595/g.459324 Transcript_143595/m.459324 type:complete len:233 (-) Transcript_143595:34-732(-)